MKRDEAFARALRVARHATRCVLDVALHPLVVYTALTVFTLPPLARWIGVALGFAAPTLLGVVLWQAKKIKSFWSASDSCDRRLLAMVNIVFYTALLSFCNGVGVPAIIRVVPLIALVAMAAMLVLAHFRWGNLNDHFVALTVLIVYLAILTFRLGLGLVLPVVLAILLMGIKAYLWMEDEGMTVRTLLMSALLGLLVSFACYFFI